MDSRRPHQVPRGNVDVRFHYPQVGGQPRQADFSNSPQGSHQFPPHPSVRVPSNVRVAGRQIPAGVGVAPRPGRSVNTPRPQMQQPPTRPQNTGQMVQDYKFPQVPPPIPASVRQQRNRELAPPSKYNMHDSYVSSVNGDSTPPRTTPSSKSPRWQTPVRDTVSVYPEDEAYESPQAAYPSSRIMPQQEFPPSPLTTNSAYPSSKTTPYINSSKTTPYINTTQLDPPRAPLAEEISPASSGTTAMNALSAAIAAGFSSRPQVESPQTPLTRTFSPMRMPFERGSRPRSLDEGHREEEIAPPELIDAPSGKTPMLTPSSAKSTNPLLGLGIAQPIGMSSKVPMTKRPPQLDIDAVRDMEARGSTTSLTELIRRATKLASNLDRGKTASRLGMLDGFGSKEKLGPLAPGNRDSTMSDMLSSFPAPVAGSTPRRETMWPLGEKGEYSEHGGRGRQSEKKRRCCGMSLPVATLVVIVLVILIAAAVLIPIFLILVPKQHKNTVDFTRCPIDYPCQNGGTSMVNGGSCQCVCSDGFLGAHCDIPGGSTDCTTMTVSDGAIKYNNATMGTAIMPLFSSAQKNFDISLNSSVILSLFSLNQLSCTYENSLVSFNFTTASQKTKRLFVVPGFQPDLPLERPRPIAIPTRSAASHVTPTATLHARDTSVGSTNGIVFQTSAGAEPTATNGAASTVTSLDVSTSSSTPTPASSDTTSGLTSNQLSFAQVVVLYVLQKSQGVAVAVNAQQQIGQFFASASRNDTVEVGAAGLQLTANFKIFEITGSDGSVVGGKGSD